VSGYCSSTTGVWIENGDSLIFIGEVADDALGEDIERSAEEDVVCWTADDMNLNV
jgi:hypothetical protein